MQKIFIHLLIIFSATAISAEPSQSIDSSKYSYETAFLECGLPATRLMHYLTTENLDLSGKTCSQAISYIKSIAALSTQYTKITTWGYNSTKYHTYFLIEYIKEKSEIDSLFDIALAPLDLSSYSHETVTMRCRDATMELISYDATDDLDFSNKNCLQAISHVKNIAAYPLEYTNVTPWLTVTNSTAAYPQFLIEYLKKK